MKIPAHAAGLVLQATGCRVVRLKALTMTAAGPMTPDNVTREAGNLLATLWQQSSQPLLVDCTGIVALSDYALHGLDIRDGTGAPLVFFNSTDHLTGEVDRQLPSKSAKRVERQSDAKQVIVYLSDDSRRIALSSWLKHAAAADSEQIQEIIRDTFHKNDSGVMESLHSTPILASGIYNARRIICEPASFNLTVLHLEERLDRLVPDWDPARHCLLSGSLRACPFAAALAFMKTPPRCVEILDHFGPHPILLEEHDLGQCREGVEYVYIGDFMIGGTEVKIADSWAARRNCRLTNALFLGTLWEPQRYRLREARIERLVSLEGLHADAAYAVTA